MLSTQDFFEKEMAQLAPTPVLWVEAAADALCSRLGYHSWRQDLIPISLQSWFDESRQYQGISEFVPSPISYQDFLERTGQPLSPSSFYQFAFETPTTSLSLLTSQDSLVTLVFLVLALRSIKSFLLPFFSNIGRREGRRTHGEEWERQNEVRIVKFGEYVFRLCFHFCISVIGLICFGAAPWWSKSGTIQLWADWPNQSIGTTMTWYYLIQCAYNVDAMLSLLEMSFALKKTKSPSALLSYTIGWSKDVRGDFNEMFFHHVVTNLLVFGSSVFRQQRIGSMIFMIHDISDVPVDLSKLANFMKYKKTTVVCFISMVLVWCVTRLGALPFLAFQSALTESWTMCGKSSELILYYKTTMPVYWILLGMLIILHLLWFTMFIQMGYVLVSKGEAHDLSEHKAGESQEIHQKTKTQ